MSSSLNGLNAVANKDQSPLNIQPMPSVGQRGVGGSSLEYPMASAHDKENKQSKLYFNPRMSKYGQGSFRSSGINLPAG